jgi:NADH/NAD ratio-sensing transcriptional regulator Rex
MICDHLVCQSLGATCLLVYGDAPDGVFDKHDDTPPAERLDELEHDLAELDVEALRLTIRAERARRACQHLVEGVAQREIYELAHTHDPDQRARREAKLLARLRALRV